MEALEDLVGTSPAIGALRRKLGRLARVGPGGERPPAMASSYHFSASLSSPKT